MGFETRPIYRLTDQENLFLKLIYSAKYKEGKKLAQNFVMIKKRFLEMNSGKLKRLMQTRNIKLNAKSSTDENATGYIDVTNVNKKGKFLKLNEIGALAEGDEIKGWNIYNDLNYGDFVFRFKNPFFNYMIPEREAKDSRQARIEIKGLNGASGQVKSKDQTLSDARRLEETLQKIKNKYKEIEEDLAKRDLSTGYITVKEAFEEYMKNMNYPIHLGNYDKYF